MKHLYPITTLPVRTVSYSHFTEEETEDQTGERSFPNSSQPQNTTKIPGLKWVQTRSSWFQNPWSFKYPPYSSIHSKKHINLLNTYHVLVTLLYYAQSSEYSWKVTQKIEAQRGEETCPKPHSWWVPEIDSNPGLYGFKAWTFATSWSFIHSFILH